MGAFYLTEVVWSVTQCAKCEKWDSSDPTHEFYCYDIFTYIWHLLVCLYVQITSLFILKMDFSMTLSGV